MALVNYLEVLIADTYKAIADEHAAMNAYSYAHEELAKAERFREEVAVRRAALIEKLTKELAARSIAPDVAE